MVERQDYKEKNKKNTQNKLHARNIKNTHREEESERER